MQTQLFGLTPEYCGKRPPEQWELWEGKPLKPYHFNRTLGAQKASSKYCQTSTAKQRELWEQNGFQPYPCNRTLGSTDYCLRKDNKTLSFFSLVFLNPPWCFSCWEFPWSSGVFSAHFPGFLRVRVVKILRVFEVFLGIFEKTKEKKDREFLDNKIRTFEILLSWRFPWKITFWTIFSLPPIPPPPPQKREFHF